MLHTKDEVIEALTSMLEGKYGPGWYKDEIALAIKLLRDPLYLNKVQA
jgi:hypothetical protein